MQENDLDNITFEQLPKGMQHLSEETKHGRSGLFFMLLIIVIVLFGAFYWYSKNNPIPFITPENLSTPVVGLQKTTPDISSLEQELAALIIPDYSSLF